MSDDSTASTWILELKRGNEQAAKQLWDGYFEKLVRLAESRLPARFRRAADGEDVALSALRTFVRRATLGEFPAVSDGEGLWRLLVCIAARKAYKLREMEGRKKRGGGHVADEAALTPLGADVDERGIERMIGAEPSPELVAQFNDSCEHLLRLLPDETLRQVAKLTLEGHTLEEIGDRLNFSIATAGRKLSRVRTLWEREV